MRSALRRRLFFFLSILCAPACLGQAQDPAEQFKEYQKLAREEVQRYAASGAPRGEKNDPRLAWAAKFWELREKNAGTEVAGNASRESLRLLVDAGRVDEALSKIDTLGTEDRAWQSGVLTVLREAAVQKAEPAIFLKRVKGLLDKSTDPAFRARLHFSAGRFYQAGQMQKQAEAAFEAAVAESPDAEYAKRSARELYDIRNLGVGQVAPAFSVTSVAGKTLSLETLRGHASVFVYWASW